MKKTISELRHEQVIKLATVQNGKPGMLEPTAGRIAEAKTMMNRFYRLQGAWIRSCEGANDKHTYNSSWFKDFEKSVDSKFYKLKTDFAKKYGLYFYSNGLVLHIGLRLKHGAVSNDIITTYHYNW